MKKIFMAFAAMLCILGSAQATAAEKIAVVPYMDWSEQHKDYIKEAADENYTNAFASMGLVSVPEAEVNAALVEAGFDASDDMLPDKEVMKKVSETTGADYVVAMAISDIDASRHVSVFSEKVRVTVKMQYRFYQAGADKMTPFKAQGEDNHKTSIPLKGLSYKNPIQLSIRRAADKANEKMRGLIHAVEEKRA